MASTRVNRKKRATAKKPLLFIISGGKLAEPSNQLSQCVYEYLEYLEEQCGYEAASTPAVFEELGWIDKRGKLLGERTPSDLEIAKFDPAYVRPLKLLDQLGPRAIQLGLRRVEGEIPGHLFDHVAYSGTPGQLQEALSEVGINAEVRAHLFTRAEHMVLSSWLGTQPNEALESLGHKILDRWDAEKVAKEIAGCTREDRCVEAAVATIVLRSIEHRLPNWAAWSPETGLLSARPSRPRKDSRKLHLIPQHLFTINWASSGPGFSWPNQYNLCWVPLYEEYVVTVSADSPEGLGGYTDLALGSFRAVQDLEDSVGGIVMGDWREQLLEWDQREWEHVLEQGLIKTDTLNKWAREVWTKPEGTNSD